MKEFFDIPEVKAAGTKLRAAREEMLENSEKIRQLEAEHPELAEKVAEIDPLSRLEVPEPEVASSSSSSALEWETLCEWSRARHAFEQRRNEVMEQMAVLNEKLDRFAESHPAVAKYGAKIIDVFGAAAMGATLFAGAEVTTATVLVNGGTMLAYRELFGQLIEGGSDKFVEYCALQGRTEAEAVRYGTAAAGIVNKLLTIYVVRGGLKVFGGKSGKAEREFSQNQKPRPSQNSASQKKSLTSVPQTLR